VRVRPAHSRPAWRVPRRRPGVIGRQPLLIAAIHYRPPPLLIIDVPLQGLGNAGLERLARQETGLVMDAVGVDGVVAIVAGAVLDER
jgi:hypothetical protein